MKQFFKKYYGLLIMLLLTIIQTLNFILCIIYSKYLATTIFAGFADVYMILLCIGAFYFTKYNKELVFVKYCLRIWWVLIFIPLFVVCMIGAFLLILITPLLCAFYYIKDGNIDNISSIEDYADFCSHICSTLKPE